MLSFSVGCFYPRIAAYGHRENPEAAMSFTHSRTTWGIERARRFHSCDNAIKEFIWGFPPRFPGGDVKPIVLG
jgi:hypothetical protein